MLYSWLTRKTKSARKNCAKRRAGVRSRLAVEHLEDRRLLSVAATPTQAVLTIDSASSLVYGAPVGLISQVNVTDQSGLTVDAGNVDFTDTTTNTDLGLAAVGPTGQAELQASGLAAGAHNIIATYEGATDGAGNVFAASNPSDPQSTTSVTITPASVTVSGLTASKVYDSTNTLTPADLNTSGATLTGVLASDLSSVALDTTTATGTFNASDVTASSASVSGLGLTGPASADYTLTGQPVTVSASITPASVTVSGLTASKVYDGTNALAPADLNTSGAVLTGVLASDLSSVALDTTTATGNFNASDVTASSASVSGLGLTGTASADYTLTGQPVTVSASITPATLTVSGITASKVYNGTPNVTPRDLNVSQATLVGLAPADSGLVTLNTSAATGTFNSPDVLTAASASISGLSVAGGATGEAAADYTITQPVTVTGSITARTLKVTAHGQSKVYDGTTAATVTLTDNGVKGDIADGALTVSYATAAFADADVVGREVVTVSGITIGGSAASNYVLDPVADAGGATTAHSHITALPVTVTANPQTKFYGTADPALTYTVTIPSSSPITSVPLTGGLTRAAGANAGTYTIQKGTLTAGSDYKLTYVKNTLTIVADSTSTSLSASSKAVVSGQPVTLTAIVSDTSVSSVPPTGKVTFQLSLNGVVQRTVAVNLTTDANGNQIATLSYTPSKVGTYTITATFSDSHDGREFVASLNTTTLTVSPLPTPTTPPKPGTTINDIALLALLAESSNT